MADHRHPVVVGVDGGVESATALRWAIAEARSGNRPLRLVHAYRYPPSHARSLPPDHPLGRGPGRAAPPPDTGVASDADRLVRDTMAEARELDSGLTITGHAVTGHGGEVLVAESARAAMVVVGARRLGASAGALLGSVSSVVVSRSRCPVVVVRSNGSEPGRPGLVVVGVAGAEESDRVLGFGFEYADRASALLRAVLCRPAHPVGGAGSHAGGGSRPPALPELALARWRKAFPAVSVETRIVDGQPVSVLVEEAGHADLLVVGARGRDGTRETYGRRGKGGAYRGTGLDLGSVSQGVLHHAHGPVAVVPPC